MHKRTQAFPHVTFRNDHAYDTYLVQTKTERCLGMAGHLKKEKNLIPNKQLHSRITLWGRTSEGCVTVWIEQETART